MARPRPGQRHLRNEDYGIDIEGDERDVVEGNFIGTDVSGDEALPNTLSGVSLSGGSPNTIGGTIAAAANLISGNQLARYRNDR